MYPEYKHRNPPKNNYSNGRANQVACCNQEQIPNPPHPASQNSSKGCMARLPGLRLAVSFALVVKGLSFQLIASPIAGWFSGGGGRRSWQGGVSNICCQLRCNDVREHHDETSRVGLDSDGGVGQDAGEEQDDLPLAQYFARWVYCFYVVLCCLLHVTSVRRTTIVAACARTPACFDMFELGRYRRP